MTHHRRQQARVGGPRVGGGRLATAQPTEDEEHDAEYEQAAADESEEDR